MNRVDAIRCAIWRRLHGVVGHPAISGSWQGSAPCGPLDMGYSHSFRDCYSEYHHGVTSLGERIVREDDHGLLLRDLCQRVPYPVHDAWPDTVLRHVLAAAMINGKEVNALLDEVITILLQGKDLPKESFLLLS